MPPVISIDDPRDPLTIELLKASQALMTSLFTAEDNHFLSVDALAEPDIRFVTARVGEKVLGCGALAVRDGYGELKSMFTLPEARGRGIAAAILARLESEARALGLDVIRLETGDLLHDAHRLYARNGFQIRGPFGAYVESDASIFMEKHL